MGRVLRQVILDFQFLSQLEKETYLLVLLGNSKPHVVSVLLDDLD